jgi:hypothetical protein
VFNKSFFISVFLATHIYSLWSMQEQISYQPLGIDHDGHNLYMITLQSNENNEHYFHKFTATQINQEADLNNFIQQQVHNHLEKPCECKKINIINK